MRHGETPGHFFNSFSAHSFDLSLWHEVHALGILYFSVIAGEMNLKVWLRTLLPSIVWAIWGMWQAVHWLPVLVSLCCV